MMQSVKSADLKGKKVLLRLDLDVPVAFGKVGDITRLQAALPTLRYLLQQQATIIILGHAGRPEGKVVDELSIRPMLAKLTDMLGGHITYEIIDRPMAPLEGTIFALENLRYNTGEEANDPQFAAYLASFGDIYVNDAFAVSHRDHASLTSLAKLLPSYAGLHLMEEVEQLQQVMNQPPHPVVAILGGAKVETKMPAISHLSSFADHILLGGKLVLETDGTGMPSQVVMPQDMQPGGFDIGPQAAAAYTAIIAQAKTIIWNGPMGKFEQAPYDAGTRAVAQAIADNQQALRLSGGGDTIAALDQFGLTEQVGYISTGGGAMLDFLANQDMPGLTALGYTASAQAE